MAKYVFSMCQLQLDFYKSHATDESPLSPWFVPIIIISTKNVTFLPLSV